jgi:hypothetical protein
LVGGAENLDPRAVGGMELNPTARRLETVDSALRMQQIQRRRAVRWQAQSDQKAGDVKHKAPTWMQHPGRFGHPLCWVTP